MKKIKTDSGKVLLAEILFVNGNKYIKKPIPIRAVQMDVPFNVKTLEGTMSGKKGDYLVEGVEGELYICDKNIFEKTYNEVKG